eukprot:15141902-Alexandrium_andersonii.AAC.1
MAGRRAPTRTTSISRRTLASSSARGGWGPEGPQQLGARNHPLAVGRCTLPESAWGCALQSKLQLALGASLSKKQAPLKFCSPSSSCACVVGAQASHAHRTGARGG